MSDYLECELIPDENLKQSLKQRLLSGTETLFNFYGFTDLISSVLVHDDIDGSSSSDNNKNKVVVIIFEKNI